LGIQYFLLKDITPVFIRQIGLRLGKQTNAG